jgi:cytochrome c
MPDLPRARARHALAPVAQKYSGDAGAAARLAEKMRAGGSGVWGAVPMPPNAGLSADDSKRLAEWVLTQK